MSRATVARPPHSISIGGLRTPAPACAAPPSWGRHPQTFTKADLGVRSCEVRFALNNGHRVRIFHLCAKLRLTDPKHKRWRRPTPSPRLGYRPTGGRL
jgi:hypothetical protein